MSHPQKESLRALSQPERVELEALTRSWNEPVAHVARARALLGLADGASFTDAAKAAGRRSGDGVAKLVWCHRNSHHTSPEAKTRIC